jgi:acetamidase/formamidase
MALTRRAHYFPFTPLLYRLHEGSASLARYAWAGAPCVLNKQVRGRDYDPRLRFPFNTQQCLASVVYEKSSVDLALKDAFRKMRAFLMNTKDLSEDEAISLISVAVDFGITQVVDGNWGVHAVIKKSLFAGAVA